MRWPPGQLGRLLRLDLRRQADLLEPLGDDLADLRLVADVMLAQAEGDVVEDRQAVEERGHLEQEPEPQPHLDQLLAVEIGDVAAVEPDAPLRGLQAGR